MREEVFWYIDWEVEWDHQLPLIKSYIPAILGDNGYNRFDNAVSPEERRKVLGVRKPVKKKGIIVHHD